ncbi:MAG: alanine--tRNA ligase [bacterium]|nr:alanine--tRNA ligase [bacterium]
MTSDELRQKYLDFFKSKGHVVIPSTSLIPENDPSVLFTTAGMHPLVPYLLGERHPGGRRLVSVQKCIRTGDIDEVGDDVHLTFFEMLGNWSLGDPSESDGIGRAGYFKKDAITWSYEFLTAKEWLGLDPLKLAVSVFAGDEDAPRDDESIAVWKSLGVPEERIAHLGKNDNWWPAGGKNPGPQGPDTEMFYWTGTGRAPAVFDPTDARWVEIWNDVFMQYDKQPTTNNRQQGAEKQYQFIPLKQKNVDTGMGLERTTAVITGTDMFLIDTMKPLIQVVEELSLKRYSDGGEIARAMRIIADHVRSAAFILGDERGVMPSNTRQGYILRRLIRRAVRYGKSLGITVPFTATVASTIIEVYGEAYPEFQKNKAVIIEELEREEERFGVALDRGLREFAKLTAVDGKVAFDLYQSYGFPLELTEELARERGFTVDRAIFETEFQKHQELSRTASAGQFKGGLTDHSGIVVRLHTATHLLNAALRQVLGDHVWQKGSNITAERTRFDFSHGEKMTEEQKKKVEELVNGWISRDLMVEKKILPLEEARKSGAIGVFGEKYPDTVSMYTIADPATGEVISREFCGGPHVTHTGEIGTFKILKEEASSAGVRRIKATVEG